MAWRYGAVVGPPLTRSLVGSLRHLAASALRPRGGVSRPSYVPVSPASSLTLIQM